MNTTTSDDSIAVIIAAGGIGSRIGGTRPKQLHPVAGVPLLLFTLRPFVDHPDIAEVVVVCRKEDLDEVQALCARSFPETRRLKFTTGGRRRQDSVANGLRIATAPLALVHDAARPLVSSALISRCCTALRKRRAIVTAIPVVDTIKQVAQGRVTTTVDRTHLYRAQTPQGAEREVLLTAFDRFQHEELTDESSLLEKIGIRVEVVSGEEQNFKVTVAEDLVRAEQLLTELPPAACSSTVSKSGDRRRTPLARIGHGFDAHRFAEGRRLILGGVEIPWPLGLAGHSDADVVTHAVCDALLGAAGLGDIGRAFPDSDARYKDISSLLLLARVMEMIAPLQIENIDISIICQAPKLAPHLDEMRRNLALTPQAFANGNEPAAAINIKATTEEKMGYSGRGEGISCHAVALLVPSSPRPTGEPS